MPETFYHTNHYQKPQVNEVEVSRATAKHVFFGFSEKERKEPRISGSDCYFFTEEEAIEHLIKKSWDKINSAQAHLDNMMKYHEKAVLLKVNKETK